MGNTFMGSRVFLSGASIDSLSTYEAMVYRAARTPGGGAPDQRQRAACF